MTDSPGPLQPATGSIELDRPGADAAHGHEAHSLREIFRERRISLRTMDPGLRLATAGALACMIGVALLLLLRDRTGGYVDLGRSNGVLQELSGPLFIATLVLLSLGFAYVLTGAVLASWPIAVTTLVVITAELGLYTGAFGHLLGSIGSGFIQLMPPWARWTSRGLIVAVWVVAAAVFALDRRRSPLQPTRRLRLTVLVVYALVFGGYLATLRVASPVIGGLNLFPESVDLMMSDIALLVTPILTVAAVDFGEWAGLLGERVAAGVRTGRRPLVVPLSAVISVGLIVFGYLRLHSGAVLSTARLEIVGKSTLMLAVALAVAVLIGRAVGAHRRSWPTTLNFAGLFAVCAVIFYVVAPIAGGIAGAFDKVGAPVEQVDGSGHFTGAADVVIAHGGTGAAAYTLLVPRGWDHTVGGGGTAAWVSYAVPGPATGSIVHGRESVVVAVLPGSITLPQAASALGLVVSGDPEQRDGWTVQRVATTGVTPGLLWARPEPGIGSTGGTVLMEDLVVGAPLERVRPTFEAIAATFRSAGQPAATLPAGDQEAAAPTAEQQQKAHDDRLQSIYLIVAGALTAVLLVLVGTIGRRWPARLVGAILLFGMAALMTLLYFADSVGRWLVGPHTDWPFVGVADLLVGLGVLSLIGLAMLPDDPARRERIVVGLVGLQTTAWGLYGMSALYDHALSAGRVAVWSAVILLVAVAWDVVMSGESMTNRTSSRLPRPSRVLAFMGYVLLVAGAVLFFSGQREIATGAAAEPFFEPEATTQNGLFRLAFPLAVLLFLLRWGRARVDAADTAPAEPGLVPPSSPSDLEPQADDALAAGAPPHSAG